MSVPVAALRRGRRQAERLMVDTCTIRRITGQATDGATGVVTPTYATVYAGKCKVQTYEAMESRPQAGERVPVVQRVEVQVPLSVAGLAVGDVVTITASAGDADLVGRVYRVRSTFAKTHATARRLACEETQA